jgi:O-antigen/teichoic acid export membrane protein
LERGVFVILDKKSNVLSAFLYNSGGITIFLICKWLITVLVVRISGDYRDAGYLALAMSVTNVFFVVAAYAIRNYQVSVTNGEFHESIYLTARLITVIAATILCGIYSMLFIGFNSISAVLMLYMLMVAGESLADVFHGIEQKHWRMDLIGLSFAFRGIALLFIFIALYRYCGLIVTTAAISISTLIIVLCFDLKCARKLTEFDLSFDKSSIFNLLKKCFPLMLMALLYVLNASVTRIILEYKTDAATLGIYASATMPAVIVMQMASFIFTPLVNIFTQNMADNDHKNFQNLFLRTCGVLLFIVCISIIGAFAIGKEALGLIFGNTLKPYAYLLVEAIFVAGLTAFEWFLMTILTVMRTLKPILIACAVGFLFCVLSISPLLTVSGSSGANYAQIIGLTVSVVIMLFAYIFYWHKKLDANER